MDFSINPTFWQKCARRRPKVGFFYKFHFSHHLLVQAGCPRTPRVVKSGRRAVISPTFGLSVYPVHDGSSRLPPDSPKVGFFYKSHFLAKVCPETSKDVQKWDFSINPTFWQKCARRRPKVGFFYKSNFLAKVCPETSKSWIFL